MGEPGEIYNICSGQPRSVQALLDALLSRARTAISVEPDPAKMRPADTPVSYGSNEKLSAATGWAPQIPFEQTISDLLDDWRERVKAVQV